MRSHFPPPGLAAVAGVVAVMMLAGPPSAWAQSSRRHRKAPVVDTENTPAPSPIPSAHKQHGKKAQAEPAASPSPKQGDANAAAGESVKPSTADEAAPAQAKTDVSSAAGGSGGRGSSATAATSSIDPSEIEDFETFPEPVRQLLSAALDLAKRNLTYTYGSADPAAGGMDCSGTIYYLLRQRGFNEVPRQASEQYSWVRRQSRFYAVLSKKQDTSELNEMRPGDLLFWSGTYNVDRDPPITHTMIYLGRRKKDGHRLMVGSSDGRPYDGQRRNGVSVFDFRMPAARNGDAADAATTAAPDHAPDFAGYGPIPGMADLSDAASRQTASEHAAPATSSKDESPGETAAPVKSAKPKHTHSGNRPAS